MVREDLASLKYKAMLQRKLGRTGETVSVLGYGSMGLRGPNTWGVRVASEEQAERMLNLVLDSGINLIDTAPDYGISEERIGRYLSGRRDEFFLATKCGCDYRQHPDHLEIRHQFTPDVVRRNLETSLQRLRTDYIDLLQFHGSDVETLQQQKLVQLLEDFRSQGLIRYIGVSSSLPQLPALVEWNVFDVVQVPYSCVAPEHKVCIQRAVELGIGTIIRGGIAQGGPEAEIQRENVNRVWQAARLDELLVDGMRPAELILRYTLTNPACHCIIVGTANEHHLAENVAAMKQGPLPADLYQEITNRVSAA